jgi:polyphosphate kinase 2
LAANCTYVHHVYMDMKVREISALSNGTQDLAMNTDRPTTGKDDLVERLQRDIVDSYDEEFEMELDDRIEDRLGHAALSNVGESKDERQLYFRELFRLQGELVKLQDWMVATGHRLVILFEGRDAAGKGGIIKRITQRLSPRVCRVAALPAPNDRERTQWYFQRYVAHLPAAGEMVLFDRSWYNRAGVERVMGFCTDAQYEEFFRSTPEFERMLVRSGIQLIKYWFSISDEEQQSRFLARIHDPLKQWKLSPMDLESRRRWEGYTRAKEIMFERTHIAEAPWWVVQADNKKRARLNCIHHLLSQVPYREIVHAPITLPDREHHDDYARQPVPQEIFVPEVY